ncbi:MAG: NAD(P)-binding domain-containing protein, partial [Hylemonella sp.]
MTAVKKSPRAATRTASKPLVGVIGLGIMGGTMAEELLRQGYPVCGHDIDAKARARLKAAGGQVMANNNAVADHAEVVIVSVATAKALADVSQAIAAAPLKRGRKPQVVVETSTLTLDDKNQSEQLLRRAGRVVLDCPISGTAVRLKERAWTIYASGERA